ncbi:MAG TPA: quinol:cytochrome C oxidoreductase [Microscillaceae bacterium]|nr:quinol:cytochrome C oxidoreductase [Microscillaceae bacterium]
MAGKHISLSDLSQEKNFEFTPKLRKQLITAIVVGVALLVIGIILWNFGIGLGGEEHHGAGHGGGHEGGSHGGGHAPEGHGAGGGGGEAGGHHAFHWTKRLFVDIWHNGVFFTGIGVIGVFFVAFNYLAQAGWSTLIKRIPETFGNFLPITGVILLAMFFIGGHDIFHWTDTSLSDPKSPNFDKIIAGKVSYLNTPFFLVRTILYFGLWYLMFRLLRKMSLKEDQEVDFYKYSKNPIFHKKSGIYAAIFIVIFAVTSSTAAWDWVMSIDTHWFSTMFGWYMFASWFVTGMATIALYVVVLKGYGYFKYVKDSHIHDLGKFIFAFSIFWTYIWFAQFLLIYYANIPEETVYFLHRMEDFGFLFYFNIIINFAFPFLFLMTRASKRRMILVKIAAVGVILGHWLDFYLMIMPGTIGKHAGFGLVEIGLAVLFVAGFIWVTASALAKANIIPKNHPMIEESLYHDV